MKIGCVKEIKNNEFRVGLTPDNVKAYIAAGHHVYIEKGAGIGSGFSDNEYVDAGASLIDNAADVWHLVDMMVKVKEPLESEYPLFREGLILYTYLHLAADKQQMDALLAGKVNAVAYETLQEKDRSLPLLAPMSQIAGRLSIQEGAKYLEKKVRRRRHPAGRRSRHTQGQCRHPGRRHRRHERLQDRRRHGCQRHDPGYQPETPGRTGQHVWRPYPDPRFQ